MKTPSLALGLAVSVFAALVVAERFMPFPAEAGVGIEEVAQSGEGGRVVRPGELRGRSVDRSSERRGSYAPSRAVADCHRDVRTHRINGVMVTHRHVGQNCEVRVVRRSQSLGPGD